MFVPLGALLLYQKLSADDRLLPMQAIARRMPLGVPCRITLAITWPQGVLSEEDKLAVAAQVHGGVS